MESLVYLQRQNYPNPRCPQLPLGAGRLKLLRSPQWDVVNIERECLRPRVRDKAGCRGREPAVGCQHK